MKAFVSFALVAAVAAAPRPAELSSAYTYAHFAAEHRPHLIPGSAEWNLREKVFLQRRDDAIAHNKAGTATYLKTVSKWSDFTDNERRSMRGYIHGAKHVTSLAAAQPFRANASFVPPRSVDYRNHPGVLSPVKNQEQCGSCWAFSATEAIESSAAINSNVTAPILSPEQITQCTPNPQHCGGTGGCNGATAELAYQYAQSVAGITTEQEYPYTSGNGVTGPCAWKEGADPAVVKVVNYIKTNANDRQAAMELLATKGPLAIAVDASAWPEYGGGVFDACNSQDSLTIDHGVLLVGYRTQADGSIVWIVRNSWSDSWGENGFIELADFSSCMDDNSPGDGTACPGGPSSVKVCGPCGLFYDVSFPVAQMISN